MSSSDQTEDMPNWFDLVNHHPEKADCVKTAVSCALKHVTEALFDLVARNEWRKVHGEIVSAFVNSWSESKNFTVQTQCFDILNV